MQPQFSSRIMNFDMRSFNICCVLIYWKESKHLLFFWEAGLSFYIWSSDMNWICYLLTEGIKFNYGNFLQSCGPNQPFLSHWNILPDSSIPLVSDKKSIRWQLGIGAVRLLMIISYYIHICLNKLPPFSKIVTVRYFTIHQNQAYSRVNNDNAQRGDLYSWW